MPVGRGGRAGGSGHYVQARRGVVLGFCAMADCLVNSRIAGQMAAAAEPVA